MIQACTLQQVQKLEEDLDHLEASSRQLLQESVQEPVRIYTPARLLSLCCYIV